MPSRKQIGLRLSDDLHAKIVILAKRDRRSINNIVEYIVQEYIAEYEKENGEIKDE